MNAKILRELAMVDRHITRGEEHIEQQEYIIERFRTLGYDLTLAESLLDSLLQAQALHHRHRDRLLHHLAGA